MTAHAPDAREARLAALRRRYLDTVLENVQRLHSDLRGRSGGDGHDNAFRLAVHSLKGSGGAYGFPEITQRAAVVEQDLLDGRDVTTLVHGLDELLASIQGAQRGLPVEVTS